MPTFDSFPQARAFERTTPARLLAIALIGWTAAFLAVRAYAVAHGGYPLAWDASWYGQIAQMGYAFDGNIAHQQNVAFLPAYPYTVRLALALGLSLPVAVTVVCVACALGGVMLLLAALSSRLDPRTSARACLLFVMSPFSLYFLNGYSESLYLLVMGAFWWALLRRRDVPLAALFAGLAGLVRPFGVVLAFAWGIEVLLRARRDGTPMRHVAARLVAFGPVAIMGPLLVSLYYAYRFDDLFLYRNILVAWGNDVLATGMIDAADHLRVEWRTMFEWHPLQLLSWPPELARTLLWASVVTIAFAARRVPPALLAYAAGLIAFCLLTTVSGANTGRHLATNIAFPVAVVLLLQQSSTNAPDDRRWREALFVTLALGGFVVQMYYAWLHFHGVWVS